MGNGEKNTVRQKQYTLFCSLFYSKVHDHKEYERERRLQARRKRRIEMGLEEDSSAPQTEAI